MHGVPPAKHRWVSKQVSNHFAHGKNMLWWQQRSTMECPRCAQAVEDKTHIIRCPQLDAALLWMSAISTLRKWMKEVDTDPSITQDLIMGLQSWYQELPPTTTSPAMAQQSLLGWAGVLDGWLGIEWHLCQEAFWKQWK